MKITKYIHSCLLIEEQDKTILVDPGNYSYNAKVLDINSLQKLDTIAITHEHIDHFYIPWVKEIVKKFPRITIVSNESVKNILAIESIVVTTTNTTEISLHDAPHEKIFEYNTLPKNISITFFNKLTHPGDSLQIQAPIEILALPIQGAWTSTTNSVEKALAIKPKYIVPIHDWQWRDEVRTMMYDRLEKFLKEKDILFLKAETGKEFIV